MLGKSSLKRVARLRKRAVVVASRPEDFDVDPTAPKPRISAYAYNDTDLVVREDCAVSDIQSLIDAHTVTWVNVEGLGDRGVLEALTATFGIHPLAVEDVVNVPQRPKVETYDDRLFVVAQMLTREERLTLEQISIFAGSNFVLTFQERPGDPFQPVRNRLQKQQGRMRQGGPDFLIYALIDAVVDGYFPVVEGMQADLEALEDRLRQPCDDATERIQAQRAQLLEARRAIGPLREVVRSLAASDLPVITDPARLFLRDCRDHILEAAELLESCREIASGLMDIHISTVSHQANQTMQVLTVIATIFMPLSFLAGIYGMNFDTSSPWNMPELASPIGYPILLGIMVAIGLGLAWLFWKRGWFK